MQTNVNIQGYKGEAHVYTIVMWNNMNTIIINYTNFNYVSLWRLGMFKVTPYAYVNHRQISYISQFNN